MSKYAHLGPPLSDSDDDDYDGFYYGDSLLKEKKRYQIIEDVNEQQALFDAVLCGDLGKVKQEIEKLNFDVNAPVKGSLPLLFYACLCGHLDIVYYLVEEKNADVNKKVDLTTPLLNACDCTEKDSETVEKIVGLLLMRGAVINVSNKYGCTPLMTACKNGHVGVVRLMLKDASLDAVDNYGCTAIYRAVEKNHAEIVNLLLKAGANHNLADYRGYTPRSVAQCHGFYDLMELLPEEKEVYKIPLEYISYNTLRDFIPRLFLKTECPEYFQDVHKLLTSVDAENLVEYFARANVSLKEFLCMDIERMEEIGIVYPFLQMRVRKLQLDFHLNYWARAHLGLVDKKKDKNFYDILVLAAHQLRALAMISASLRYVKQNLQRQELGAVDEAVITEFRNTIREYNRNVQELQKLMELLSSMSPERSALYIELDEHRQVLKRQRNHIRKFLLIPSLIFGISAVVCFKWAKYVQDLFFKT